MTFDKNANSKSKVLVFQLGSIGDTVATIPSLKAIRRYFGAEADICLLHETRTGIKTTPADLLSDKSEVNRFIRYPFASTLGRKLMTAIQVWWRLKCDKFQSVVYLMPSERTAEQVKRDAQFFRCCGIHQQIGFRAFSREFLYPVDVTGHPGQVMHEALCRLERLRLDGIDISKEMDLSKPFLHISQDHSTKVIKWLDVERKQKDKALVAICPGSKQPANLWPVERFIEIGERLIRKGKYELIVVGGPAESQIGSRMVNTWGEGLNAAGQLSVLESAALLGQCAFCVGLDTGTTHLAAAQGTPCVALYGERDNQGRFEPLGKGHIVLRTKVPCAGCRLIETPCPLPGHPCMMDLEVNSVWEAIMQMEDNLK
ncbi:MAG: glycosyltransferase family 9 protein [Oryzomonas sp.]|uniref:glycosyltransferase family 9 protein n=1 Tax=Oryzomonas sp. TaxID=2855186 RepID=UPI00284BD0D2|nr:glycosyltransferase family 9 protein [Oryzomonas sp.]MDR3580290.1 glycosyltransferase family 9 protein [Oryzomonas sp.]